MPHHPQDPSSFSWSLQIEKIPPRCIRNRTLKMQNEPHHPGAFIIHRKNQQWKFSASLSLTEEGYWAQRWNWPWLETSFMAYLLFESQRLFSQYHVQVCSAQHLERWDGKTFFSDRFRHSSELVNFAESAFGRFRNALDRGRHADFRSADQDTHAGPHLTDNPTRDNIRDAWPWIIQKGSTALLYHPVTLSPFSPASVRTDRTVWTQ